MYQISKNIIFCTYSSFDLDAITDLNDYWILYRYNEKLDVIIIGEVIFDSLTKQFNRNSITKIFKKNILFDKSLSFENKDRLHVYTMLNDTGLNYGFELNINT